MIVYLLRADQILQLFQPREGAVLKDVRRHIDSFEQFVELLRPAPRVPGALETRQVLANFLERNLVTPVVGAG